MSKDTFGIPKNIEGMGFRNFHDFNDAFLAKQCWRLLQDPNSLCARVLKARNFPHCSFLEAQRRSRASWAWTSLLVGRNLLLKGSY